VCRPCHSNRRHRACRVFLWAVAPLGVLWNVYGVYQFVGTFTQAGQEAMTAGMTAAQAALYLSLPAWISAVFALGVLGGLAGSIALLLRRRAAQPILAASLVGYVLLFAGDAWYGVFAAMPSQLAILAVVVLIAAALLWVAHIARQRGLLR
jgi:hypothetical protein